MARIPGPVDVLGDENQEQHRGIHGAVVGGGLRDGAHVRQLSPPQLVKDLARAGVPVRVVLGGLISRQQLDGGACDGGAVGEGLERDRAAVAPEQRHVPGHAGREIVEPSEPAPQQVKIEQRAAEHPVEEGIVAPHLRRTVEPDVLRMLGPSIERPRRPADITAGLVVVRPRALARLDADRDRLASAGAQAQREACSALLQPGRRRRERQSGDPHDAVGALVRQMHLAVSDHLRRPERAARLPDEALDHEQVLKAGAEP